jgi:sodium/bile acid cotransporter 7
MRFRPDGYAIALLCMVGLATLAPVAGAPAKLFGEATNLAIALLFFLHGARLSRQAIFAGMIHWRLHLVVFLSTFLLFPLLGWVVGFLPDTMLEPGLTLGVLFLCCLPSTVQSSIAFTSIAGGNVPAAVCSASASNLIGVVLTPLLAGLLLSARGAGVPLGAIEGIVIQILLPFAVGQGMRRWVGPWIDRHRRIVGWVDRGSILMVVYGAFSDSITAGLWHKVSPAALLSLFVVNAALLGVVLAVTTIASRKLGFSREDEIAIVFCGSKKSLASGAPMANILFSPQTVGMVVLPLMLFHQIQLMVCSVLAQRYAARRKRIDRA